MGRGDKSVVILFGNLSGMSTCDGSPGDNRERDGRAGEREWRGETAVVSTPL